MNKKQLLSPMLEPRKKTLNEIWGIMDRKYKQKNELDYKIFIREMNDAEICLHCRELNLPHFSNRLVNLENLEFEFHKYLLQKI